jgi:cyclophilin family peptidyl-prolyl cis-trans isomerase
MAPHPVRTVGLALLTSVLAAGCGDDPKPTPKGPGPLAGAAAPTPAASAIDREAPSPDAVIAELQHKIAAARAQGRLDTTKEGWRSGGVPMRLPSKPAAAFDASKTYVLALRTDLGTLRFRLHADRAPRHVANALYLALLGFYDGTTLHRIAKGKAIEGGCPIGDGNGSPGYAIETEGTAEENAHARRGLLASTGVGGNTDDSKFRVLLAPDASLDKLATVYGELLEGDDVLKALEALGGEDGRPTKRVVVQRADIELR